ncbi:enoyl-CoA hydratase/isomerase family protein [Pimelobacter simplex]|uniref:enoyl-CoA hydratase/isomerase family protein n=1 Tax=Nocardioides simplex TaxID=2045 RepID=UPI0038164D5D
MSVDVVETGRCAEVTFHRPGTLNALDLETVSRLADIFVAIAARADLDVVVLRGGAPGFCAGGDLGYVATRVDDLAAAAEDFLDRSDVLVTTLLTMPQVSVAVVDGVAAGAGLSLAAAADVVLCSDRSTFHPAYARLGVPPDLGGSLSLRRRLGSSAALQLLLRRSRLDARAALAAGLVDDVLPAAGFDDGVAAEVERLLRIDPLALRSTKAVVRERPEPAELSRALAAERRGLVAAMTSPDYVRRVREFLERGD